MGNNYDRIEWIPPVWAMEEGTEDTIIASSILPRESIYIMMRQRPPITVTIPPKYEYQDMHYFGQVSRTIKEGSEPREGTRKRPVEYFMERRNRDGSAVLAKNKLRLEEAYIEWLDSDNKVPFYIAFPNNPELQSLQRNPRLNRWQVAERFWQGKPGKSVSMTSTGDKLYSYNTVIAQRLKNGEVVFDATHFSPSTGRHQTATTEAGKPDHIVWGMRMGRHDLNTALMDKGYLLIATSNEGDKIADIMILKEKSPSFPSGYFCEYFHHVTDSNGTRGWPLDLSHAYREYLAADQRLIPVDEAFPADEKVARLIKRYGQASFPNPAMGKRHWHYPFSKWHQEGTKLLASSSVNTSRGPMGVNLYRTRSGRYMREIGFDLGGQHGETAGTGRIQYITRSTALLDFRDADQKFLSEQEAFQ